MNGLRGEIHALCGMVDWVRLDNASIDDWSLGVNTPILARTSAVVFGQPTAH